VDTQRCGVTRSPHSTSDGMVVADATSGAAFRQVRGDVLPELMSR
jgi:hypothetical protein